MKQGVLLTSWRVVRGARKAGRSVLEMCRMHTESAMLLGQVAAGEVAVDLEGVRQEISLTLSALLNYI